MMLRLLYTLCLWLMLCWPPFVKFEALKKYAVVAPVLGVAAILVLWRNYRTYLTKSSFIGLVCYTVSALVQFGRTGSSRVFDFLYFSFFLLVIAMTYGLLRHVARDDRGLNRVLGILYGSSLVISSLALWEGFSGSEITATLANFSSSVVVTVTPPGQVHRAISLIGNSIPLSVFCGSVALIAITRSSVTPRFGLLVVFCVNALACLFTFARSGILAFCFTLGCQQLYQVVTGTKKKRTLVIWLAPLFLVAGLVGGSLLSYDYLATSMLARVNGMEADRNVSYRLEQWNELLAQSGRDPVAALVGNGPGALFAYYGQDVNIAERGHEDTAPTVDNTYISLYYQFGLLGLGGFLYVVGSRILLLLQVRHSADRWMAWVLINFLISAAFYEFFAWFSSVIILCLCFLPSRKAKPAFSERNPGPVMGGQDVISPPLAIE